MLLSTVLPAVVDHPRLIHLHLGAAPAVRTVPHPAPGWPGQAGVVGQGQVVLAAVERPGEVGEVVAGDAVTAGLGDTGATVGLWQGTPALALACLAPLAILP